MPNPFLLNDPFVSPSLNRVRIATLPESSLFDEMRGKTGYELLSAAALTARIQAQADMLELESDDPNLLHRFDGCFTAFTESVEVAVSPKVRSISEEIARDYGRALGCLLLTLKRGDSINREARAGWTDCHWEFWASINQVWIGGGLVAGHLGPIAIPAAARVLRETGFPNFKVHLSPHGADLPLLGLSRLAPAGTQAMLLLDFGQTAVKRAVAEYKAGELTQLHRLPSLPSPCESVHRSSQSLEVVEAFADRFLTIISEAWQGVERPLASTIAISLACYLRDGQPPPSEMGCYGRLQRLSDNIQSYLADQLSQRLDQPIHLHLYHDGTAAALPFAAEKETAVLMLGTAVGVGFPGQGV